MKVQLRHFKFRWPLALVALLIFVQGIVAPTIGAISKEDNLSILRGTPYYSSEEVNNCLVPSSSMSSNKIYIVGDSYSLGVETSLRAKLKEGGYEVVGYNAHSGRSINGGGQDSYPAKNAISDDSDKIQQAGTILIILGTNGDTYNASIPEFMKSINSLNSGARKFWVNINNVEQEKAYITQTNQTIAKYSDEFKYTVIDWYSVLESNRALYGNNLHPSPTGYQKLADEIINSIGPASSDSNQVSNIVGGSVDENKKTIFGYFIGKGLTPVQTAAIMGNLQAEGGFEPKKVQYGTLNSRGEESVAGKQSSLDDTIPTKTPGGEDIKGGYGLAQWTSTISNGKFTLARKQGLIDLLKVRQKTDPSITGGNLGLQLDYIWQELNSIRKAALKELKASGDIREATKSILYNYEAPENMESKLDERTSYSKKILEDYGSTTGITLTTGCTRSATGKGGANGWELSDMVYYAQTDSKWANIPYSSGCAKDSDATIESSGCGIASMAMIISTLTSNKIEPPEMAKISVENGFRICDNGTSHGLAKYMAAKYNLKYTEIGQDFNKAAEVLRSGGLVWVSVGVGTFTSGGHLMVIRKVSDDGQSFYLADPYSEKGATHGESNTKAYSQAELLGAGNLRLMYGLTPQ